MAAISCGRAVVELLKAEGVRYVFGIVGSTFLDVLDTLYDDKAVQYVNAATSRPPRSWPTASHA